MEVRYQVIYRIVCVWNITIYKRIRNISKAEAEMLMNSPLLPEMVGNGRFESQVELIRSTDFDYRYLYYVKEVRLAEFRIPCNCRLIWVNELQKAIEWVKGGMKRRLVDNCYVTFFN